VKKIKEKPDEVKRVIKVGIKANRYIRQNREGTAQVLSEWLKIDSETAVATYDSISKAFNDDGSLPESGLRILIDEAKRDNKITRDVTSNEVAAFRSSSKRRENSGSRRNRPPRRTWCGGAATKTRNISRKGAKHVLSSVEGAAKKKRIVISTEGRNLSQIPRIRSG
jgi:hypothetical protein